MATQDDDVTPHLNMREFWHATFDEVFQAFSPDEWTLEPTDSDMPGAWRRFKDGAKVKFRCECGNSWTSMAGRIIFWYKKIDEKDNKKELKTKGEKGKNNEGKNGEQSEESGTGTAANKRNKYSLRFRVYGQQCKRCDDESFRNPRWYKEEVTRVLNNVHQKIGEAFYDFPKREPDNNKRHGRMRRPHDSRRCQACHDGQCNN